MIICGVEIKSNYAILCVVDKSDDIVDYVDLKIKKITLENDEKQEDVKSFFNEFSLFLKENKIDKIVIKKRAKKGTFSGGAVTFKIEGMIQMNTLCEVVLISSATINSFEKKNEVSFPSSLKKYQEQTFISTLIA